MKLENCEVQASTICCIFDETLQNRLLKGFYVCFELVIDLCCEIMIV